MFEKEAKEYSNNWKINKTSDLNFAELVELRAVIYKANKGGAEFGYNKANEWHYPSKGELPKEDTDEKETLYLLWGGADDSDYISGVFSHGRFWCFDSGWFEVNEIIAWKEIVRPKEIKEK